MNLEEPRSLLTLADTAFEQGAFSVAIELLETAIKKDPRLASPLAVQLGHCYLLNSRWEKINQLLPRQINFFENTGWLDSICSNSPLNRLGQPIPWWTYSAIEFIAMRIDKEARVYEWGSGNSTRWWAERVAHVRAVEHDKSWFNEVSKNLPKSADLILREDKLDYVRAIEIEDDSLWDIVVIDGESRSECATLASRYIKPSGIIIFDNTDCPEHREGLLTLMRLGWKRLDFFGLMPSYCYESCTSVFYQSDKWTQCPTLPSESEVIL